jgi:hypothetical protein
VQVGVKPKNVTYFRFRDDEFPIPRKLTQGQSAIRVRIEFAPEKIPLLPLVKLYGMASGECGRLLRESDGKSGYGLAGLVGVILVLFDKSFQFRLSQRVSPKF